jgi:hypothetical protein
MNKMITVLILLLVVTGLLPYPQIGTADAKLTSVKVVYFKPPQVNVASTYKIDVDINKTVEIHGWITIVFPEEWTMPDVPKPGSGISEAESNELERILNSIYLATSPCTKCQGLPVIKTNKRTNQAYIQKYGLDNENSITFWSHIQLTPDGPYDPIPITVAGRAGFKNAPNPGKYRIGIRTHQEMDTVYSNEITVVKSQVEPATVTLTNAAINEVSGYNVKFRVGEGGSLDRTTSRITMVFPKGTVFPETMSTSSVKLNGRPLAVEPQMHQASGTVSLITPTDIENLGEVNIEFSPKAGIKNTYIKGEYRMVIKTDFEPDPVESKPFNIVRAGQRPVVNPPYTSQFASYKFSVDFPKTINPNDMIEIIFPKEVTLPQFIKADATLVNDTPCTLRPGIIQDERKIRVYAPMQIKPGTIMIEFTKDAKIKNPDNPGSYQIKFSGQGVDGVFTTDPYDIFVKKLSIDDVKVSPINAKINAAWELTGSLAYNGDLAVGDTMTLEFPEGTEIPSTLDGCVTVGGTPAVANGSDNILTITMPQKIVSGGEFKILISKSCQVRNPPVSGDSYVIKVTTSKDQTGGTSETFFIAPPIPVSTLLILKDSKKTDELGKVIWTKATPDGKDGWFKTPPSIDFTVDSPTAKIRIWWNDAESKAIDWEIGKPLGIADQQRMDILHWQALDSYGNEDVRSFEFKIDTNSPTLSLSHNKKLTTKINKVTIAGLADPTELLKYEDKANSPFVVPDIFINGEKVDVVPPKVLEMTEAGPVFNADAGVFKKEFTLDREGTFKFEVWAEDQAGWVSPKQIVEVTYDKTPPEVKLVSPVYGDIYKIGQEVEVKVQSEISASIFINNTIANLQQQIDDNTAIFSAFVIVTARGENFFEVKASDPMGNAKTEKISIWGPITLNLWLDQKTLMNNGVRKVMVTAPTSSSPPLPKELKNNTYMPIRDVAEVLFAEVGWINETKTVTLKQSLPGGKTRLIELTIGNTKAKIDGKEVLIDDKKGILYPAIVGGKTMLPVRFVSGAMGASIGYDDTQRMITIDYPKPKQ